MADRPLAYKPLRKMSKYPALSEGPSKLMDDAYYDTKSGSYVARSPIDTRSLDQAADGFKKTLIKESLPESLKNLPMPKGKTLKHPEGIKKGGAVKKYCRGGGVESKGKTRGRFL